MSEQQLQESVRTAISRRALEGMTSIMDRLNDGAPYDDCHFALITLTDAVLPFVTPEIKTYINTVLKGWDEARPSYVANSDEAKNLVVTDAEAW